jgi:predicted DNA-binding protein
MKTTKMCAFTLKLKTIERLEQLVKKKSINKSGFVDRIINGEIDKEEKKK